MHVSGHIVDILSKRIYPGTITIDNGFITSIVELDSLANADHFILPGFVDAHIHIESSMVVPYEFAKIALRHGTVATISDPHEIANVLGLEGVEYMIQNGEDAGLKFHFGAPSCVPATSFETAGATLNSDDVLYLLKRQDIYYLSEMMNYPGVLFEDKEVMRKIDYAHQLRKPIDGHAPGLSGQNAVKYIQAGISTDHECFTLNEALFKLSHGMKIIIREGSAAKNFEALHSLIDSHPDMVMFCSDDKHPDELIKGHINELVIRAISLGYNLFDVLKIACINPVKHYKMKVGTLNVGDPADFILVEDLTNFNILSTYINGEKIFDGREVKLKNKKHNEPNKFCIGPKLEEDFMFPSRNSKIPVINAIDGQLITEKSYETPTIKNGCYISDQQIDLLKIVVVNRYFESPPAIGFIRNMGVKNAAFGSTVAHDSHNIICVGTDDKKITECVNYIISARGGLAFVSDDIKKIIPLPVAGLMSSKSCEEIGLAYQEIDKLVKASGSSLKSPFMTLSFMALLVIPKIKISDKGVFDAENFVFY